MKCRHFDKTKVDILKKLKCRHFDKIEKIIIPFAGLEQSRIIFKNVDILRGSLRV